MIYMNHKTQLTPDAIFLLSEAKRYCSMTGIAPATLSTKIMNDGKFLDRVKAGKGFTSKTYYKVKDWFSENMPETKPATKRNSNSAQANT